MSKIWLLKKYPKIVWSNKIIHISFNLFWICHECFVNHSLGIKEIWFQKYLGQKILDPNKFSKRFWICFESVRNVFWTWMLCESKLSYKRNLVSKIFGTKTFFGQKIIWSIKIFQIFLESVSWYICERLKKFGQNCIEKCFWWIHYRFKKF